MNSSRIWASDFAYDDQGRIKFPRKIISFTDKTRYIFHVPEGYIRSWSTSANRLK